MIFHALRETLVISLMFYQFHHLYLDCGLEHVLFFHIFGITLPIDIPIFQSVDTTNQIFIGKPWKAPPGTTQRRMTRLRWDSTRLSCNPWQDEQADPRHWHFVSWTRSPLELFLYVSICAKYHHKENRLCFYLFVDDCCNYIVVSLFGHEHCSDCSFICR